MANEWQGLASKVGPQIIKHIMNYWNNPGLYTNAANVAAGAGAGAAGAGAGAAAEMGASGAGGYGPAAASTGASSFGAGGVGMTAGGVASVAAPLIMAYLKYQAGSGRNDPVIRKYQTQGAGRMIADLMGGKKVDPASTYQNYFVDVKNLPAWMDPNSAGYTGEAYTPGNETIDPRGYSLNDLWHYMHKRGAGNQNQLETGNSGFTDTQIDQGFGLDRDALSKLIGQQIPDWSAIKYGENFFSPSDRQKGFDEGWGKLDPAGRMPFEQSASNLAVQTSNADMTSAKDLWQRQQEQAEVEKLLGRQLNPKPWKPEGTDYNF